MRSRSLCRCLLCQLELRLEQRLQEADQLERYSEIAGSSLVLAGFPNGFALTTHLHSCRSNGHGNHPADTVLLELLRLRQSLAVDTGLLRDILLLAFIPVLHSTSRQIARRYASVPADDVDQHLVATFLEALDSTALRGRNSHLAFALSRLIRRNVFDWAKRESRTPGNAVRDEPLIERASVGIPEPFERAALLRHFLFHCERQGLLTAPDVELIVHIKLEGSLSEPGEPSAIYSNALRQKVKRLLNKLREAAR